MKVIREEVAPFKSKLTEVSKYQKAVEREWCRNQAFLAKRLVGPAFKRRRTVAYVAERFYDRAKLVGLTERLAVSLFSFCNYY